MKNRIMSFEEAIYDLFSNGKNEPMYNTYIDYALKTNKRGESLAETLSQYVKFNKRTYLDIGTAYGGFIIAFSKRGCKPVFGFDIDERLLKISKINLKENNLDPNCVFKYDICNPLLDIFKEKKIHIITCVDVIEHVSSIPEALKNIKTLIANGGYLYLEMPNRNHINNILSDPHFGLFGITLLDRIDAIEYFKSERNGEYSVGDFYDLEHIISFFSNNYYDVIHINQNQIDIKKLDLIFKSQIQSNYKENINNLSISIELKEKLTKKLEIFLRNYEMQIRQPNILKYHMQNWKLLIYKKGEFERFISAFSHNMNHFEDSKL